MAIVADDLSVINEALARLGSAPVFSLAEESPTADKVSQIYPTVVDDLFDAHRWLWARRTVLLDRLPDVPATGYGFAYALPGNRIGPPVKVLANPRNPDTPLRRFSLEGDELHADAAALWATCVIKVGPEGWPPAFKRAAVTALAAELCVPISHDRELAADLRVQAWGSSSEMQRGGLVGRAIARDANGDPGPAPLGASSTLTDTWWGG